MLPRTPRSAADILASAQPPPPKKPTRAYKRRVSNPFASNENLAVFLQDASPPAAPSNSASPEQPTLPYSLPTDFKFRSPYVPKVAKGGSNREDGGSRNGGPGEDILGEEDMSESEREMDWSDNEYSFHVNTELTFSNIQSPDTAVHITSSPGERRRVRAPRRKHIKEVLKILRDKWLSPFDLILDVLDERNLQYFGYRNELYKTDNTKLGLILQHILSSTAGQTKFNELILDHSVDLVCKQVTTEMDAVKENERLPGISEITPTFIKAWNVSGHQQTAPILYRILVEAAETAYAKEKNKKKTPIPTCNIIMKQLAFQRSQRSLGFPGMFGLFLWTTGCQRQTIEALHRCGLSVSYTSVLEIVETLANHCMTLAIEVGSGMHALGYDNINISTSIFTEQRGSLGPAKVTSGTFAVLYKLRNGDPRHMRLAPMLERLKQAPDLDFNHDIRPKLPQLKSFEEQLLIIIVSVLPTYCEGFESYADYPLLQHKPRRPMPSGYITEQYPTRVSIIEEATTEGNLLFHDEVYVTQLRRDPESLSEYAIPTYNDQMTNSRIRSGQLLRSRDSDPWTRRQVFQLGLSLFHLCLNLVWLLLHVHRGSLDQTGSLTYFFAIMEKARLGGEHPDYHSLLAALIQILHGLLLNAWRSECGLNDLKAFAKSKPTPEVLLIIANKILRNHATPMPTPTNLDVESDESDSGSDSEEETVRATARQRTQTGSSRSSGTSTTCGDDPAADVVHQNIRLLTRDLLYVAELIQAISDGDIGRVEDFLPQLAMIFRGAGGNNYCTEILHFILNLRHVWTPEFADIMRDNMLVNFTGQKGHSMGVDLNIEHLIGELKTLLSAKGLNSTWDRLGNISAAIDYLKKVKKQVSTAMGTAYQSTTHSTPVETVHLVWRVANKAHGEVFEKFKKNRTGNLRMIANLNTLGSGEKKLRSSTLGNFNKKVSAMKDGLLYTSELDIDTLPPIALGELFPPENE